MIESTRRYIALTPQCTAMGGMGADSIHIAHHHDTPFFMIPSSPYNDMIYFILGSFTATETIVSRSSSNRGVLSLCLSPVMMSAYKLLIPR